MGNSTEVGWVSGPDGRGTMNIIWTCLTTLFLCIWASWHPDIPKKKPKKPDSAMRRALQKLRWVLFLLILPEGGVMTSVYQAFTSYRCAKVLKSYGYKEWTFQHCMYAEMGGMELELKQGGSTSAITTATSTAGDEGQTLLKVRCADLIRLREAQLPPRTPPISCDEIEQMSKADVLVKGIALAQVLWFLVSAIARTAQNLPVSQLEVMCLAYVFYAAVVYVAWWHKPLDVAAVVHLQPVAGNDARPLLDMSSPVAEDIGTQSFISVIGSIAPYKDQPAAKMELWKSLACSLLFAVFGGIHCVAWNSSFDSVAEKQLWRSSSVLVGAIYPMILLMLPLGETLIPIRPCADNVLTSFVAALIILYPAARMFIIVEAFVSLRRAPAALYETVDWTKFLPHIT